MAENDSARTPKPAAGRKESRSLQDLKAELRKCEFAIEEVRDLLADRGGSDISSAGSAMRKPWLDHSITMEVAGWYVSPLGRTEQQKGYFADLLCQLNEHRAMLVAATREIKTDDEPSTYVRLDQMAAIVQRSKRTLEDLKSEMPPPKVPGGGGKPAEWVWEEVRPWLENKFNKTLPKRFPASRMS